MTSIIHEQYAFPEDVWTVIKSFAVGFDAIRIVHKSKLYKELTQTPHESTLIPIMMSTILKGQRFLRRDDYGNWMVCTTTMNYNLKSIINMMHEEDLFEPDIPIQILGTAKLIAYLPTNDIAENGCRKTVRKYNVECGNTGTTIDYMFALELLNLRGIIKDSDTEVTLIEYEDHDYKDKTKLFLTSTTNI
jgi:hypothetical protein